jgi:hypothetical protein
MIQRGGGATRVPMLPVTPPLPDSLSVPQQKVFTALRSVDRVAAADVKSRIKPVSELQRSPGSTQGSGGAWYEILFQKVETNAETCHHDNTNPSDDPTWGFSVFVTSYSLGAQEELTQALENWIRAQELWLEHHVLNTVFRDEMITRFKLDVVYDDSLEGASDDRIRAEFRAWMAGLGLTARGDESPSLVRVSMSPNSRENICLALDETGITMLAGLMFTEDLEGDFARFESMNVRATDCTWRRPAEVKSNDTWRGIGDLSIVGLAVLFEMIASPVRGYSETGMMHDLHPLAGMPDY